MKVTIKGIPPYDGEYTLDFARFTNGEYHRIKHMSGYTVKEFPQAMQRVDTDWITALGAVAAARNHGLVEEEIFWAADAGAITIDFSDEQVEGGVADPPTVSKPDEPETTSTPSGKSLTPDSELHQDPIPQPIGIRTSA